MRFIITSAFILFTTILFAQTPIESPIKEENGQWGIWNDYGGCWLFKPTYDKIISQNFYYKLYKDGAVGMKPWALAFDIPIVYEDIQFNYDFCMIAAKKGGQWGCISHQNKVLIDFKYDEIQLLTHDRLRVAQDGLYGVLDYNGQQIIPAEYEQIEYAQYDNYYTDRVIQVTQNGQHGLMSLNGERLLPCQFKYVKPELLVGEHIPMPKLFPVGNDASQWGFADATGQLVIDYSYDAVSPFYKGSAIVKKEEKLHLINEKGEMISPQTYSAIDGFDPDNDISIVALQDGAEGLINLNGSEILPPVYTVDRQYYPDRYRPKKDQGRRRSSQLRYMHKKEWNEGEQYGANKLAKNLFLYKAREGKGNGIIDAEGNDILPLKEHSLNNYFRFGRFGYGFNTRQSTAKPLFHNSYDRIELYHKNEFLVLKDMKHGILDVLTNQLILPCEYSYIDNSRKAKKSGLYILKKDRTGKKGMVDRSNKVLIPFEYGSLYFMSKSDLIFARRGIKCGLFKSDGQQLLACEYDEISSMGRGFYRIKKGFDRGIIDSEGTLMFPMHNYYRFGNIELYNGSEIVESQWTNDASLPEGMQFVTTVREDRDQLVINMNGQVIDTIKSRSGPRTKPIVRYEMYHGTFQHEVTMPNDSTLRGKDIDPEIIEKWLKGHHGFFPKSFDYPPFKNSYFLDRKNEVHTFERIQLDGARESPVRWVRKGKYFGLINAYGELIVPYEYEKVGQFKEGLICLVKDGKVGFVNEKGETVIPFEFDDDYNALPAFQFINGYSVVCKNDKYGLINKAGDILVPIKMDVITFFDGVELLGFDGEKWELVSLIGE